MCDCSFCVDVPIAERQVLRGLPQLEKFFVVRRVRAEKDSEKRPNACCSKPAWWRRRGMPVESLTMNSMWASR